MSIFNLTDEKMKETSSTFTAHEIYQQPATWRKTCAQLAACKDELQAFIDQVVKQDDFDIVLTGAGTSEFVGNSLFQALNPKYAFKVNEVLKKIMLDANIRLIDFKLEFGRLSDGTIILADEISPDTCRFWDATTGAHLDKDLFRRSLGGEADAYQEVMKRLLG